MSVKVEVSGKNKRNYCYPALFIDEQVGLIVLLTSAGTGTVIESGTTTYDVGYHGSFWKMERLVPFLGSVKLENK